MDFFSDRGYRHRFDRTFLLHAVVAFGALGSVLAWRRRRLFSALGLAAAGCLLMTYGGSYVRFLSTLQPYRFLIPATILALGPAVIGVEWLLGVFAARERGTRLLGGALAAMMLPQLTGYVLDLAWTPPVRGLTAAYRGALDAVRALPGEGRVLCDDMNLGHLIPSHARRAVIGGLSTQAFLKHRFAGMDNDGSFFGRQPAAWNEKDLRVYLNTYAVEWALLSLPDWVAVAERHRGLFEPVRTLGGYRLYRVREAQPSLVLEGRGDVDAGYNRIAVRNARTRALVLKLHYTGWLSADAGVKLEPAAVLDDPVPFIRATLPEGVYTFVISGR
jgi:hypothetical protein